MLNLLITIGNTVMRTIPLLLVLMIIMLCYSFLGVVLFSDIMKGEGVSYRWVSLFRSTHVWLSLSLYFEQAHKMFDCPIFPAGIL